MAFQETTGVFQFRNELAFTPNGGKDLYVGHRSLDNEQAFIESDITIRDYITIKLNSLQGQGNDAYVSQDNINAFQAAFITPFKISRVDSSTNKNSELYIDYVFLPDQDSFEVSFNELDSVEQLINVGRIYRAIWNGGRDNDNIMFRMFKALDPLRDVGSGSGDTEPYPQFPAASTDVPPAESYGKISVTSIVPDTFLAPTGAYGGGTSGSIVLNVITGINLDQAEDLIVRFKPIKHDGTYLDSNDFTAMFARDLKNTLGIDISTITLWITIGDHLPGGGVGAQDHYFIVFNINDDPLLAKMAFNIIEAFRFGMYDKYHAFKNATWRDLAS